MATQVDESTFDSFLSNANDQIVSILCSTTWCGPCRVIKPQFENLKTQYPDVLLARFDMDECPALAKRYNIQSIPTILFFRFKQCCDQVTGANIGEVHCKLKAALNVRSDVLPEGQTVKVRDLTKNELNGQTASVVSYDSIKQRYVVSFDRKELGVVSIPVDKLIQLGKVAVESNGDKLELSINGITSDGFILKQNGTLVPYCFDEAILSPGHRVTVIGLLNSPQYNGLKGRVESHRGLFAGDRRYLVTLGAGHQLRLKPVNCLPFGAQSSLRETPWTSE
eukprot:GHVH01001061.1.p1 GENE.GHVH01001061.1~~GHVH01001061.1.p1  ORF type:complete len:280 (+),score=27.31 GHVH01001061.1:27-866(+)